MTIARGVAIPEQQVRDLCRRYGIAELSVFGSVLRNDFGSHSDVDFVVRTLPGRRLTFRELGTIKAELSRFVGRPADVVLQTELDGPHANPYRRAEVLRTMERVYAG